MSEPVSKISAMLDTIEISHGVRILLAIESGSRAWGFPSPDSDYDVRFIYAKPVEFYLQVRERRDVIEQSDGLLDVSGWDVRKCIGLLLRSNASAVEWLRSPIVYRETQEAMALRSFAASVSVGGVQRHYFHLARSIWRERFARGEPVNLKKYFYLLRPALALRFIRETGEMPPMDLPALLSGVSLADNLRSAIDELVSRKAVTRELDGEARLSEVDAVCIAEMDAAERALTKERPPSEDQYDHADSVFRQVIGYRAAARDA